MFVHEMDDRELAGAHAEALAKAKAARANDDLDLAQRYIKILRAFNVEMYERTQARKRAYA